MCGFAADTMDAVGHLFAVEGGQLCKNRSLMVCFIDIGASQIQVSIQEVKYTESVGIEIQQIGYAWSDRVGSDSIDVALTRLIHREIVKQKPDAIFDDKSVQKIVAAARKVKLELTLQPEGTPDLADLIHKVDLSSTFSIIHSKSSVVANSPF
jgi:molecular chaperone DnaK (HSP70)